MKDALIEFKSLDEKELECDDSKEVLEQIYEFLEKAIEKKEEIWISLGLAKSV